LVRCSTTCMPHIVLRYTLSLGIQLPEVDLRMFVTLVSGSGTIASPGRNPAVRHDRGYTAPREKRLPTHSLGQRLSRTTLAPWYSPAARHIQASRRPRGIDAPRHSPGLPLS